MESIGEVVACGSGPHSTPIPQPDHAPLEVYYMVQSHLPEQPPLETYYCWKATNRSSQCISQLTTSLVRVD